MPSRATQLKLLSLQRQCQALTKQAEKLQRAQANLVQKQHLLKAICDTFSHISATRALRGMPRDLEHLLPLMEEEARLLQQLEQTTAPTGGSNSTTDPAAGHTLGGVRTVAPRSDPMAFFMLMLSQPPEGDAEHATAPEVARVLASTVKEASIQLHLLQDGALGVQAQGLANLERLWVRYCHILVGLLMCGRQDVMEQMSLYNLSTLAPEPDVQQLQAARTAAIPAMLDLTEQQLQEIGAGAPLFADLLGRIWHEQQQLQADLSAQDVGPAYSSDSGSTSPTSSVAEAGTLHSLHKDLEGHERSAARMHALLHKEYVMRAASVAWLVGCLDWKQLTKAAVLSWPYPLRISALAQEIVRFEQQR